MVGKITAISNLFSMLIDKAVPNKDRAMAIKSSVNEQLINLDAEKLKSATTIISAEANGESWLQRNWRPLTMLVFTSLIVCHWLGFTAENLDAEQSIVLLEIVKVGLGGYVVGRSLEKAVKAWNK